MIFIVMILTLALIFCTVLVLLLKRDIRLLGQSLHTIRQTNTNMRLETTTFDKDICTLCNTMNDILDRQKAILISNEKANREFRQVITNISHDLRTPLTSALGYTQMLNSNQITPDKEEEYLNIVEDRLRILSKRMNELFEYAQIMEGKMEQNTEKVNVCNSLRDVMSAFYTNFTEQNFRIQIEIPDEPVYVYCDAGIWKRVVENLIRNVLEHGIEQFCLEVDTKSGCVIFRNKVENGELLDTERIFDRFYTSDPSRSGKNTGIGLTIVKELIQNMSGTIHACGEEDVLEIRVSLPFVVQ